MSVDIAPGVAFARHSHPGEEIINVLEGSLEYQVEGKPPVTLKAGDVLFIPARAIHSAKNVGSGNAAELATYVSKKGSRPSCRSSERSDPGLRGVASRLVAVADTNMRADRPGNPCARLTCGAAYRA